MTDSDDFFEEAPTAVHIRPRIDDTLVEAAALELEEEDLDPAAFRPMATRYPSERRLD